jgi:hypothetical protein
MRALRGGIFYFALVFGTGFVLGSVRVPFLVPHLGVRVAELIETRFMQSAIATSFRNNHLLSTSPAAIRFLALYISQCSRPYELLTFAYTRSRATSGRTRAFGCGIRGTFETSRARRPFEDQFSRPDSSKTKA